MGFYASGNLRQSEVESGDSIVSTFYYDSIDSGPASRFWEVDETTVRAEYYATGGELMYRTTLAPKKYEYSVVNDTFRIRLIDPSFDYFSLSLDRYSWNLMDFLDVMKNSDGIYVRIPIEEIQTTELPMMLIDKSFEGTGGNSGRFVGEHWYDTIKVDL